MLPDYYHGLLQNNVCIVEFTKVDGTLRRMVCTTKPSIIRDTPNKQQMIYSENQVRVFDIEAKDWRSFLKDSVISFVVYDNEVRD